jgi:ABC-type branched-subunit amino acid transport system substrate-binding protein
MEIHCTRIGCARPLNIFPELEDSVLLKTVPQRHCHHCGMHLILDGRYIPFQRLRQGGFGSVFLAFDRRTPAMKRCIVKQLQFNTSFTPAQIATATTLFHREAEVLESLGEHPRIPRFFAFLEIDAEEFTTAQPQRLLYLVQDYIEGQDLQRELQGKGRLNQTEVKRVLQEVLEILDFMHSRNVIHRDIKPSNIVRDLEGKLHLIDFGAVKQIISTATTIAQVPALGVTGICTPEYAPAEQRQCHAIYPSSDLYALGVTCLHLLSGEHPPNLFDFRNHTWLWDKVEIDQNSQLFRVLERMLKEVPVDRFQSAREALVSLNGSSSNTLNGQVNHLGNNNDTVIPLDTKPQKSPSKFLMPANRRLVASGVGVAGGLMATGLLAFNLMKPNAMGSFGNYALLKAEGTNNSDFQKFKADGITALSQKNYPVAVQNFQAALTKNPNAPETRIFLNNALIGSEPSQTIAVSIPINEEENNYRALEMLRGFAHAQQNLNSNKKTKIKIEIFDDNDKKEKSEGIAKQLADRSDILGVVGHNSSGVSLAAAEVYNSRQVPFITPVSISSQLTGNNKPYIFRTNVRGEVVAQELANLMLNKSKKKKAAIFYVPKSSYSKELQAQFSRKLISAGGEVVGSFDISEASSIASSLKQAFAKKAEVIVLFPSHKYRKNAWAVLRNRQEQYPNTVVFGDIATLYSYETLNEARSAAQGMILGVSWHIDEQDTAFSRESRNMWQSSVNWATATSYNALQAMGTAIQSDPKPARSSVRDLLGSMKFAGAAGDFQFFNGDPNDRVTMVKVEKTAATRRYSSGTGYDFVPLNPAINTIAPPASTEPKAQAKSQTQPQQHSRASF